MSRLPQHIAMRHVRVLFNPRGIYDALLREFTAHWDRPGTQLFFQISKDAGDGAAKAREAVAAGADVVIAVGGDGMVNTIGAALVGSDTALGVIPTGSGNGFARHFGIPLDPAEAVRCLRQAKCQRIDVGLVNQRPFFVTCSMAWDAALVRTYQQSPVRGIAPYVLAAAYEFISYEPQPLEIVLDGHERLSFPEPIVFTVANLTQFGGGAMIAPQARPDDGALEMVQITRQSGPLVLAHLPRLFSGMIHEMPGVIMRRFKSMEVKRPRAAPIQVDGELVEGATEIRIGVQPMALNVLTPAEDNS